MSMRYVLAGLFLLASILLYQEVNALPKLQIKVEVTPPSSPDYKDDQVLFLGGFDVDGGKVVLQLKACGSLIVLTVPKQAMLDQDPEILKVAQDAVDKACK